MAASVALATPVPLGSAASAAALATLHAKPRLVQPGGTVEVRGKGYSSNASSSNIEIHLDGRQGPIIATFSPRPTFGDFISSPGVPDDIEGEPITIPAGTSLGVHTLVATQYNAQGDMVSGLPGRSTIEVVAAAGVVSQSPAGATVSAAREDAASVPSWPASTRAAVRDPVAAALALLSLIAVTLVLIARNRHVGLRRTARLIA